MPNVPRQKGTKAETQLVQWFHNIGQPQVERHALHGNHDLGDLTGIPGLVVSVKFVGKGKPMNLSGWLRDLAVMQDNVQQRTLGRIRAGQMHSAELPTGLLVVRRAGYPSPADWYAVQPLAEWWEAFAGQLI